ncbi:O-fucosyltransferase 16 isoform X1 [Selaginella moellendorffii]|uniref:O-fucosyltransferase 16 isoform X1 n=1 Tax=Selaginella moellendorffii TaxID=88036 RepID=UPI000D1D0FDB|nr:O-fucosyltransferase 16 isoform X1 [Selaginella moellendorffii]|eukprot:XP_024514901.1 O-fucosyltransferase 16 isoform X1 [Selaginella moellendorffii]
MARRERSWLPSIRLLLCGLTLVVVASLSILATRFLDLDHDPRQLRWTQEEQRAPPLTPAQDLSDVPPSSTSDNIWSSKLADYYYGCNKPSSNYSGPPYATNGFLLIQASGGLNQQRIGITDAVVVARILNATLVVPSLDHTSFWKDNSNFSDIFDIDWFIATLAQDVRIVKELPTRLKNPISLRVPRKSTPHYYQKSVLPTLVRKNAVRLTKFDYRLANNLSTDLQKLRCRVNYDALQFTGPIEGMGRTLVQRMKSMSGGRFIALHLRYEPDMLAFSGCYYGGGDREVRELASIRKRWKNLRVRSPERERRNGKCPLTPMEVGLMLRALGFSNETYLYVASGDIYGGESTLAPLRALFPHFFTKESLASDKEMEQFSRYSSRMAAIDYIVCNQSDVFVTNNNGNMARILAGHRRYAGHKRTIRPNAKKLGSFFGLRQEMGWEQFAAKLRSLQKGFMGDPMERSSRRDIFENPRVCICDKTHEVEERGEWMGDEEDELFNIDEVLLEHEPDE